MIAFLALALAAAAQDGDGGPVMRHFVTRTGADLGNLERTYDLPLSTADRDRFRAFFRDRLKALEKIDFDGLDTGGKIDHTLMRHHLAYRLRKLEAAVKKDAEVAPLLPFADGLLELMDRKRRMETVDPRAVADVFAETARAVRRTRGRAEAGLKKEDAGTDALTASRTVALRASRRLHALREKLKAYHAFYAGYHPEYGWWASKPYATLSDALKGYGRLLRERLARADAKGADGLIGDPIGREALLSELEVEMIPYTPEELLEIGKKQFAWCEEQMRHASREMGLGDDWKGALDRIKADHVPPGKQPQLIRDLARESERFIVDGDYLTVPKICSETWRMEMMSPERQKISPYFTGGEVISVSFPTDGMSHESKLMSLRGNNIHFARATVHHELIPGHHLQLYMADRYRTHRRAFRTPFLVEGWPLYWEMRLWDLNFHKSPADRVGMLFWRMHRAARIIVTLGFHLGRMSPKEMVDFLVDRVGHEPDGAEAEVRRYIGGHYGPLYQCAYLLGGLQLTALHRELVTAGPMTERAFHDAVLKQNAIPVEMIRAALKDTPPARDFKSGWRFD